VKRFVTWLLAGIVVIGLFAMLVLWLRALNVNTGGGTSAPVVVAVPTPSAPSSPPRGDSSIAAAPICALEGDARSPRVQRLNELKNRAAIPLPRDIDSTVTMQALLAPGSDAGRFNTRRAATISGYVADVKVGGVETVNCHADLPADRDTHIELTLEPNNPDEAKHVIVEVTPRWRAELAQHGDDGVGGASDHGDAGAGAAAARRSVTSAGAGRELRRQPRQSSLVASPRQRRSFARWMSPRCPGTLHSQGFNHTMTHSAGNAVPVFIARRRVGSHDSFRWPIFFLAGEHE
jgi:hypothetical protein